MRQREIQEGAGEGGLDRSACRAQAAGRGIMPLGSGLGVINAVMRNRWKGGVDVSIGSHATVGERTGLGSQIPPSGGVRIRAPVSAGIPRFTPAAPAARPCHWPPSDTPPTAP